MVWGDACVAHLDTGYTEHSAFGDWAGGAAWLRVADGLNLREPGQRPRDPLEYEGNPGHGTRTRSILCGEAVPLSGRDGAPSEIGVAPRLPVVPCRIVDSVVLTPERNREAVKQGLKHAVRTGCQVVSISLGVPGFPPWAKGGMGRGVDRAYKAGVIMVAAAGQIIDRVCYPAKYDRTIGVGGVTWERRIWFRYNNGEDMIDVWAPAEGVPRADSLAPGGSITVFPIEGADPGASRLSGGGSDSSAGSHSGKYGKGAGTSYATAHVAAAAAMWLLARKDDLAEAYSEPWQRVEVFRRACCAPPPSLSTAAGRATAPGFSTLKPCSRPTSRRREACGWPPRIRESSPESARRRGFVHSSTAAGPIPTPDAESRACSRAARAGCVRERHGALTAVVHISGATAANARSR